MTLGPSISHTDQFAPKQSSHPVSHGVQIDYSENTAKEGYGPVEKQGTEIQIKHPAPDIRSLILKTHIEAQLHEINQSQWDECTVESNDGTVLYDRMILSVADDALREEGIYVDTLDIPNRRLYALFLTSARGLSSPRERAEYLQRSPRICSLLNYSSRADLPSTRTLRLELNDRLQTELADPQAVQRAQIRAVYAVYRNGIVPPKAVRTLFGFDTVSPPLDERSVARWVKQRALQNWIRFLFDNTTTALTFGRKRPQLGMLQFLGVFAASARNRAGFQTVPNVVDWDRGSPTIPVAPAEPKYVDIDRSVIPKGSSLPKYIDRLPLDGNKLSQGDIDAPSITAQFDAVHRDTLSVAKGLGLLREDSFSLASDLFKIEWTGNEDAQTIDRPPKSENDVRSEWTFALASIIEKNARFTLGTRLVPQKSEYPEKMDEILSITPEFFDVDSMYADSEIVSGELLKTAHSYAGPDFVVKAPDHESVKIVKALTPKNCIGFVRGFSWNCNPKPNLVAYPLHGNVPSLIVFPPRDIEFIAKHDAAEPDLSNLPSASKSVTDYTDSQPAQGSVAYPPLMDQFEALGEELKFGSKEVHASYFTGRNLPDRSAGGIHFQYYNRWAIEENINQLSNDFLARIDSSKKKLRVYGMNTAILFQNWHTLINRTTSPQLGLRLSITHSELLKAIEQLAFGAALDE